MGDKLLLPLLILTVVVGILAYDGYLRNKGEVSPLGQIIDMAGLARYDNQPEWLKKITRRQLRVHVTGDLKDLKDVHDKMREQRLAFLKKRQALLAQIAEIETRLDEEAKTLEGVIRKEQEAIEQGVPWVETSLKRVMQATGQGADAETVKSWQKEAVDRLMDVSGNEVPRADWEALIEEVAGLSRPGAVSRVLCPSGVKETCRQKRLDEIETVLNEVYQKKVDEPQKQLEEWGQASDQWRKEMLFVQQNFEAVEDQLSASRHELESQLAGLAQELIAITDTEMALLGELFVEFSQQQKFLMENTVLLLQRLESQYGRSNQVLRRFLETDGHADFLEKQRAVQRLLSLARSRDALLQDWHNNEVAMMEAQAALWEKDREFFQIYRERTGRSLLNLQARSRRSVSHRENRNSSRNSTMNPSSPPQRPELRPPAGASPHSRNALQPVSLPTAGSASTARQMQRLRDQAHDQGF